MRRGIVAVVVPLAFFGLLAAARADRTDERGATLLRGEPYKVRLSAALWLSSRPATDERAVLYLVDGLRNDRESTVRRVAALALARLVGRATPTGARDRAIAALADAARGDRDRKVRANAQRALTQLRERAARAEAAIDDRAGGRVFLYVGAATDATRKLPAGAARGLESAVRGVIGRKAPQYAIGRGGELPTVAALRQAGQRGFYLATTVAELSTTRRGGQVDVHCKVAVRVTPWAGADAAATLAVEQTASATGSGTVTSSGRQQTSAFADCVAAVGEEVTARQVLPFLRRFEGRAGR